MTAASAGFLFPKKQRLRWRSLNRRSAATILAGAGEQQQGHAVFRARNGIYHALRALGVSRGDRVLVPAYICSTAVEPIVAYGAEASFYRIRRDCQPDFADIENAIDDRTRAILLVHYFGFPQPVQQFRDLCDRRQLILIEDCAHVLPGEGEVAGSPLGTLGDAAVFSWAKFLPVYDGGELVLNRPGRELRMDWQYESLLFSLKVAKNVLDRTWPPHGLLALLHRGLETSKRVLLRLANSSPSKAQALDVDGNSASFRPDMVNFPMTRISRLIAAHSDLQWVAARRRENYLNLATRLAQLDDVHLLFPELPRSVCPWVLPVIFKRVPNAHLLLRDKGVPATTWGGVRFPAIRNEDFPDADFLYENLVFLPIHQDLKESDLEAIVRAVQSVLENGRPSQTSPCDEQENRLSVVPKS